MKRRRIWTAVLVAAVLAAIAAIIALSPRVRPTAQRGTGRTVTDLAGREINVPDRVRRLIALGPGALRLVAYLDATDRIVGIEDFERRMDRDLYVRPYASVLDDDVLALPVVGTGGPGAMPDLEKVLMCRPDLIVAVAFDPGQLETIQARTGVPTIYLSYGELGVWRDEARRSLVLLGELLGKGERAAAVNATIASLEKDLRRRTADVDDSNRPSVYLGGISYKGAQSLTSTEAGYPPARLAGARNLADELGRRGHVIVDAEQILLWNPAFIFVDAGSRSVLEQDFQRNRNFYRLLNSATAGRVYSLLPYNYYNTNIDLALLNAYFIGKTVYPNQFDDVSVEAKACEIMEAFLGIQPDQEIPAFHAVRFPPAGPVEWR
ncbi:MAG: iron ABC transporter substrate-binding protein [Planctomycetota bacterium]